MTIRHHPSEETLAAHASGNLPLALGMAVDAHLDLCALCRQEMFVWRCVGGALLDNTSPATLSEGALQQALARIETNHAPAKAELRPRAKQARERWLAPGIRMQSLWRGEDGSRAYRLRVGAGGLLPHHAHDGVEMTCVLSGAFWDGDVRYAAGDFLEASDAHVHQPRVDGEQECVCVIGSQSAPRGQGIAGLMMRWLF